MVFEEFKPVVSPRMNVRVLPDYGFYRVLSVEPVGVLIKDFGKTLAADAESKNNELEEVYMQDNEMAQWRIWVLDPVGIKLKVVGQEKLRGATKYSTPLIRSFSPETNDDDSVSQFFSFEDEKIYVDIVNLTKDTLTSQRIKLIGYKYVLEKIDHTPEIYTDIPFGLVR